MEKFIKKDLNLDTNTLKLLRQAVRSKTVRQECNLVIVEGDKVIEELASQKKLQYILSSDPHYQANIKVFHVKNEWIERISTCQKPQKLIGVASLPKPTPLQNKNWVLVFDRLQDPGNVGTLIRSAHALGWEGVFFIEPGCDPFNEKALRASRSALFHLPYYSGTIEEMIAMCPTTLACADLTGDRPSLQSPLWLVLGQEGGGIQQSLGSVKKFSIPMQEGAESLNVSTAGSILLYVLKTPL